jgi:hypothetical protein
MASALPQLSQTTEIVHLAQGKAVEVCGCAEFTLVRGQTNRARKFSSIGRDIYVHIGTRPPTWWLPQVRISKGEFMLGWLRAMFAVSVGREDDPS